MLTKFVSIGSYSPEVRTFGTLITSTKEFSLIINDPLPRDFRLCTQRFDDPLPRNCRLHTFNNRSLIQLTILAITRPAIRVSYATLSLSAYRGIL